MNHYKTKGVAQHRILFNLSTSCAKALFTLLWIFPLQLQAEFALNFTANPNVVNSVANVSCPAADGGMMMGGGMGNMGGVGPGCGSDRFLQELVNDNGTLYYHIILGDPTQDDFAMEYYIRSAGCCWWSAGGMGGMGGGDAPFSSSYGNTNNALANANTPLAPPLTSGTGTGNPSRVYMVQINNGVQIRQRFEKNLETRKPRISQYVDDGSIQLDFDLDMRNGGYDSATNPTKFINTLRLNQAENLGDFDMATDSQQHDSSAGRYHFAAGSGHGGSLGTYFYEDGGFDVYTTDWLSYCDADQNPDQQCNFTGGDGGDGGGGMMMGGG